LAIFNGDSYFPGGRALKLFAFSLSSPFIGTDPVNTERGMSGDGEVSGHSETEVMNLLQQFDFNWHLVADHLDLDANELREQYSHLQCEQIRVPKGPLPFSLAHVRPEHVGKLQEFVHEYLFDQFPVLFNDEMTPEQLREIAVAVILEMGLPYELADLKDCKETYEQLQDEAVSLAKWRDQLSYLTILEEALFRISVGLVKQEQEEERSDALSEES
jgi:hypothetical protein